MRFIFTKMLENQIQYDHTFTTYEHRPGTNLYSFQYPEHWLSSSSQRKSVKVRSVRVNAAARDINLNNLLLYKGTDSMNISFNFSLASGEDMSVLNSKLDNDMKNILEEYKIDIENDKIVFPATRYVFSGRDYAIRYNFTTGSLIFAIRTPGMFFKFHFIENAAGENIAVEASDDFCSMLNLVDGDRLFNVIGSYQANHISWEHFLNYLDNTENNVYIGFQNEREVNYIEFKNVWNRSNIIITSSLSSMCENKYLMLSNTVNRPPKTFEINGFNRGFELSLIDLDERREIELPADGKDKIVVEMILIAA